ncbi:heterogeneous nuclear ribonucleoprotein U-like [Dendronephthya gigantea]|uniref:heterogeneous nuclear ribonucleoprotein U-like n=1 Tax=Dendronephthya gigantea TaxID=151771 RepID=UPI00106CA336|nr:heterogeneous nuclear ribonucleoprotein U-like [Dendronephthya gigantea]
MSTFSGNGGGAAVFLDEYNSDLNFVIESDGVTGSSLHKNGFEYIWAGARATQGVSRGKVCYEVLVKEKLEVHMPDTETKPHVMRVGWSVDMSPLAVGEAPLSYGYGGTGKASCNNRFFNYGEPYSTDDVIMCYIDLDAVPKAIFFAKNGKYLDVAFRLGPEADGKIFYPHISVKNMRFIANFGGFNTYFPPVQSFYLIQHLPPQMLSAPPLPPKDRCECEVLMMVGLPSSGKTTWLDKYVKDHPEKKYNILGTNDILVKMKVMGLGRKRNYHGRWDALIKQATGILNEMLKVAKHKNRNYILDQTNVYPNARRRKMGNFQGYHRIAVVMVNENSVLMQRNSEVVRRDGKVVPESAFMEMKSNFTLPVQGESFDEVWYVEENRERSQQLVREFNEEGGNWKEEQKKRPVDEVTVKAEPITDFKKPKYGDSDFNQCRSEHDNQLPGEKHQSTNSASGYQHPNDPQNFHHRGQPTVPVQESHPGNSHGQGFYQKQNTYSEGQQQYNQQHQKNEGTTYQQSGRSYNHTTQTAGSHTHGHEGLHQGQSSGNPGYQPGRVIRGGFPRENSENNQHSGPQRYQGEGGQSHPPVNSGYHQAGQGYRHGQGDWSYAQGNPGNSYHQAAIPQGNQGDRGSYHDQPGKSFGFQVGQAGIYLHRDSGSNYSQYSPAGNPQSNYQNNNYSGLPRRNDNSQSGYGAGVSQGYPVKQESSDPRQGTYQHPNESYRRNQPGDYDATSNYPGPNASSSQRYYRGSNSGNPTQQGGFYNQSQGYWGGGQEWTGPDVPQPRQDNWNQNQRYH